MTTQTFKDAGIIPNSTINVICELDSYHDIEDMNNNVVNSICNDSYIYDHHPHSSTPITKDAVNAIIENTYIFPDRECDCNFCNEDAEYEHTLKLHDKQTEIHPENIVILNRFSSIPWKVGYGWFSYEGNRKICGWYLVQLHDPKIIKPIQEIDLDDIYVIQEI